MIGLQRLSVLRVPILPDISAVRQSLRPNQRTNPRPSLHRSHPRPHQHSTRQKYPPIRLQHCHRPSALPKTQRNRLRTAQLWLQPPRQANPALHHPTPHPPHPYDRAIHPPPIHPPHHPNHHPSPLFHPIHPPNHPLHRQPSVLHPLSLQHQHLNRLALMGIR